MIFGKLIRDKIPDEIHEHGNTAVTHQANDEEFFNALINKVKEEANNLAVARDTKLEEMADLMEVINNLNQFLNLNSSDIEAARLKKKEKKGGFDKRLILETVTNGT